MRAITLHIPAARRILDFGCGTGWVLAEAEIEGTPFRAGVDCSHESLHKAQQYPGISFVESDGLRLPFAANTFDVVIGHVSMPYMNTAKALREIYRVMSPGGSLFLTFHSFRFVRERLWRSLKRGNWKDVIFSGYMSLNGVLNHLSLPQMQAWWKPGLFETVNTARGVQRAARKQGFTLIATEQPCERIFFAATARKPNEQNGAVLPEPGWSIYCPLARQH